MIAKDLISLLKSCDQPIEPNLIKLEEDYRNNMLSVSASDSDGSEGGCSSGFESEGYCESVSVEVEN